jgi:hypothetical protein
MRRPLVGLAALALALGLSTLAHAQDAPASPTERRQIQVLRDPYDLASYYRSGDRPYFSYGSLPAYEAGSGGGFYSSLGGRHSIASFYRQGGGGRYAAFWQSGYRGRPLLRPGVYGRAYGETIGENGDLYLLAPFLAPLGPLTGALAR